MKGIFELPWDIPSLRCRPNGAYGWTCVLLGAVGPGNDTEKSSETSVHARQGPTVCRASISIEFIGVSAGAKGLHNAALRVCPFKV